MGTSTSQPSPDTPNWRVARALLGRQDVLPVRQAEELWRAALADRGERLMEALGSPELARAVAIAGEGMPPVEALRAYDAVLHDGRAADLMLDVGRRALARAAARTSGSEGFATELFAELTSYYTARDLSGIVGSGGRVLTPGDAVRLKSQIRNSVQSVVRAAGGTQIPTEPVAWRAYVGRMVGALQGGERGGSAARRRRGR